MNDTQPSFRMPAGINGLGVCDSQTRDQTRCGVQHQAGPLNHSRHASRCIITNNNTQTGAEVLGEQITLRNSRACMCTVARTLNLDHISQRLTCEASESAQLSWREYLRAAMRIRPHSP